MMNITLTGSIGRIGQPLAEQLLQQGHRLTIISSHSERRPAIEALGATPAIGQLQDPDFLATTFKRADAVYVMVPPANYFDPDLDLLAYFKKLGDSFATAIRQTKVGKVVNLSSIGAHLSKGNGLLEGTYHVEQRLNELPDPVSVVHIRPTEIYYNLYQFMDLIRHQGLIGSNLAPSDTNVWVSTKDIAATVAEELIRQGGGRYARYVASDERTYQEVASALGHALGKPALRWTTITDEQLTKRLKGVGMKPDIAEKMTEMYAAIRSGLLYEDYRLHRPQMGTVKIEDFAKEFAAVYHSS